MKYQSYLFDFDGTLVDSMPSYIAAMLRILDEGNIAYGEDIIKIITPLGYGGTAKYYVEKLGLDMPEEKIVELMKKYAYHEYAYNIKAKTGVIEALKALKASGADLHILTASPHEVLDVCLGRLGIADLFTNIWSCDDFETTKANPEIYKMATEKIGRGVSEVLFLDDNYNALKTASKAGMPVCGVYDASSEEYTDEIRGVSNYYVRDLREILDF